jgi:hypothetical protein
LINCLVLLWTELQSATVR